MHGRAGRASNGGALHRPRCVTIGCDRAYSYDDDELERCRSGLAALSCPELDTAHVTALCGKAFYLKTW